MRRIARAAAGALALGLAGTATAGEAPDHYAAEPSETLAEAVENFAEYNGMLADVLAREDLTVADMERIHELTYTLEVALAKINEHLSALPATLEEVHLSSEDHDAETVRAKAAAYLETAGTVVPAGTGGM
jgi:hypothetical protein